MAEPDEKTIEELLPMLSVTARHDVKFFAMQYFNGLSGSESGRKFILSRDIFMERIIELGCDTVRDVVKDAIACLINIAGDDNGSLKILAARNSQMFVDNLLANVVEPGCLIADPIAMLLSNLTRTESGSNAVIALLTAADPPTSFDRLVQVMCLQNFNKYAELDFLFPFLANLSQISRARRYFMDKEKCVIQRFLSFTQHPSIIKRQAVGAILKNCSFDTEYHDWLLSPAVDIVPALLLPLAGPEEFSEDEEDQLPVDLQYLPDDKQRETIPLIRRHHLEALIQLCATAAGRKYMKDHRAYLIIRELCNWEVDEAMRDGPIMNLIDLLIGDEPDVEKVGSSNLKKVDIPQKYVDAFNEELAAEDQAANANSNSDSLIDKPAGDS